MSTDPYFGRSITSCIYRAVLTGGGKCLILVAAALFLNQIAAAQTLPCGNIVGPKNFNASFPVEIVSTPIEDCGDPFGVTTDPASTYEVVINGQVVGQGETIVIDGGSTNDVYVNGVPTLTTYESLLYRHEDDEYRYVDLQPPESTIEDIEDFSTTYFSDDAQRSLYMLLMEEFWETGDIEEFLYEHYSDPNEIEEIEDNFYEFFSDFDSFFISSFKPVGPGTYTMLIREYVLIVTQRTWWQKFRDLIIPTVHAQSEWEEYVNQQYFYTTTFTIETEEVEPEGASSVLFLPGIQASRLYTDGILGTEDRLWEPTLNNDVKQLAMTSGGESIEDIYTRDIMTSVFGLGDVYEGFARHMTDLVADDVIADWTPFAYDWRYDVFTIAENGTRYEEGMRSLVEEVEYLAEGSFSGKVTIIGHSNGGLLGKALIDRLEEEERSDLIDRFIMIGTPQLGTPKAIGTLLHGYKQEVAKGFVVDDYTAREVINNLPGGYGLLPSRQYLEEAGEPLITFDSSLTTSAFRDSFGTAIDDYSTYIDFLNGNGGPVRSLTDSIATPAAANSSMYAEARQQQEVLDDWQAPGEIEIVEIVGSGLLTMKGIEYREITEGDDKKLKPYAVLSKYGDETVMQLSAESYVGGKQIFFVDLERLNETGEVKFRHFNLTEIPQVSDIVTSLLSHNEIELNEFISTEQLDFSDEYSIETIDSPVRPVVTDNEGNITGVVIESGEKVIREEIPGSQYFELGGTKYVVLPKETERTTRLYGEGSGNYTLTVAVLDEGDDRRIEHVLVNAPVTPTMVAEYASDGEEYSSIKTDLDGDGSYEIETTLDGENVTYTHSDLTSIVKGLDLSKKYRNPLLDIIKAAQTAKRKQDRFPVLGKLAEKLLLVELKVAVRLYERKKIISHAQAESLIKIIDTLMP